jgi:RecA-family ATPase
MAKIIRNVRFRDGGPARFDAAYLDELRQGLARTRLSWVPEVAENAKPATEGWQIGDISGKAGKSLVIYRDPRHRTHIDFNGDQWKGDDLALIQALKGTSFPETVKLAAGFIGLPAPPPPKPEANWPTIMPVPADAPPPPDPTPEAGEQHEHRHCYRDADGRLLYYVDRFADIEIPASGKRGKRFCPLSLRQPPEGPPRWVKRDPPRLSLYGLERLAGCQQVLLVEGEHKADEAQRLAPPGYAVLSVGSSGKVAKLDYGPLRGRPLVGWPDADRSGLGAKAMAAALAMAQQAGAQVRGMVDVQHMSAFRDGWDLADPWPDDAEDIDGAARMRELIEAARPMEVEAEPKDSGKPERSDLPPLVITKPETLQDMPIPPRRWAVPNWVPVPLVTGLYGDAGLGKSLLLQMLDSSASCGLSWLGIPIDEMPVLGVFCEDPEEEMHRRQANICRYLGVDMRDLGNFRWMNRFGEDNILMEFDGSNRHGRPTDFYYQLRDAILDLRPKLLTFDTVADIFGGNENDRQQVRYFIQVCLGGLARLIDGAVVVSAHPSRAGLRSGEGDGGSTAWAGGFRSRLYLSAPKADAADEALDTNERILARRKANYAPRREDISLLWQDGVFIRTTIPTSSLIESLELDANVLQSLRELIKNGQFVPAGYKAPGGLAQVVRDRCKRYSWASVCTAQERLLADGKLVLVPMGPPSRPRVYIRPADMRYPGEK